MRHDEKRRMRSDRGAIFLETALVMPLFMILLCLCVDLPGVMSLRQRLTGASRMVAEVRARNNGRNFIGADTLEGFFFDGPRKNSVKFTIASVPDKSPFLSGMAQDLQNAIKKYLGSVLSSVINFLANFLTGGNLDPYILEVFDSDKFYSGRVDASMETILPSEFYDAFVGKAPSTENIQAPYTCYMTGCDSCINNGESFIQKLVKILHGHFK